MRMRRTAIIILAICMCIVLQSGFAQAGQRNAMVFDDGRSVAAQKTVEREASPVAKPLQGTPHPNKAEMIAQGASFDYLPDFEEMVRKTAARELGSEAVTEALVGVDTRVRNYTGSYPARAVVLIDFNEGGCTGFMISRDTVATAGHCVHSGGSGGSWYSGYRVYPGYNSGAPYGSCGVTWKGSVQGWTDSGDEEFDYGVLKLDCNVGDTTGYFNLLWKAGEDAMMSFPQAISGYPVDRGGMEQLWQSHNNITDCSEYLLYYKNDTSSGNSGSPLWFDRGKKGAHVIGIHTRSVVDSYGFGTRITEAAFANYQYWITEDK
jgi:glutamyl endopeptidase